VTVEDTTPTQPRAEPVLTSQRLRLREFRDEDLDVLAAMVGDDEQMTFYPRPKSREEAAAWIRLNRELYATRGFGTWLIEVAPRAPFAGYCGIRPLELDEVAEMEIGWHVLSRLTRRKPR
jgi:RimJ/RimL family protein N-acetyltransferase